MLASTLKEVLASLTRVYLPCHAQSVQLLGPTPRSMSFLSSGVATLFGTWDNQSERSSLTEMSSFKKITIIYCISFYVAQ
jgi:hypothetical protein